MSRVVLVLVSRDTDFMSSMYRNISLDLYQLTGIGYDHWLKICIVNIHLQMGLHYSRFL